MGNSLEFILKLQDLLSPAMKAAAAQGDSTAAKIKSQFTGIEYSGKMLKASVLDIRAALKQLEDIKAGTHIKKEFDDATKAAAMLQRRLDQIEGKSKGGGLKGIIAGAVAGVGLFSTGKEALKMGAEREQQRISFGVMAGSQKEGDKLLEGTIKMGAATPYEAADLIKNAQTLKAFGIENQRVLPILSMIGDVAAGNKEKLGSLSLAFAQVSSAGKLSGQDLLQMINAGYNPLKDISEATGIKMADLKEKMEKGAISAGMVEKAFQRATGPGGQFYQMMEKQSQTLAGRYSTFMDNAKEKLLRFGQALMPLASWILDFGSAMLQGEPWAIALASAIGILAVSLTYASIQASVMSAWARSVAFFTGLWTGAQNLLNAAFWTNPITWVVAGIIALIAIIGYVIYTTDGWGKQWDSIVKFFKFSWASFKDYFALVWLNIKDEFMTGLEVIEKGWYHLKSLWDKEGADAGLARINSQQNERAAEIAKAKGVLDKDLKEASTALKWELHSNGKGLSDITTDLKKKLGIGGAAKAPGTNALTANAGGGISKADFAGLDGAGKSKSDNINSGGQRNITVTIGKQIEKLEVHVVGGAVEVAQEIETAVREAMRRVFYSLNGTTG